MNAKMNRNLSLNDRAIAINNICNGLRLTFCKTSLDFVTVIQTQQCLLENNIYHLLQIESYKGKQWDVIFVAAIFKVIKQITDVYKILKNYQYLDGHYILPWFGQTKTLIYEQQTRCCLMLSIDCNLTDIMNYAHTYISRSNKMLMINQKIHEPAA